MPLNSAARSAPVEDFFHVFYFGVNTDNNSVTVLYRAGIKQPDGTVMITKPNVTAVVRDIALLAPLFARHRPALKADLYQLCQDARVLPVGTVS